MTFLQQLSTDEKQRIGIIYRNLARQGFKKSILGLNNIAFLNQILDLKVAMPDGQNTLEPSKYVTIMQAIYNLYGWGEYDDDDERCWLFNKIKSDDFKNMISNTYGSLSYLQLLELIKLHKKNYNLKIDIEKL